MEKPQLTRQSEGRECDRKRSYGIRDFKAITLKAFGIIHIRRHRFRSEFGQFLGLIRVHITGERPSPPTTAKIFLFAIFPPFHLNLEKPQSNVAYLWSYAVDLCVQFVGFSSSPCRPAFAKTSMYHQASHLNTAFNQSDRSSLKHLFFGE